MPARGNIFLTAVSLPLTRASRKNHLTGGEGITIFSGSVCPVPGPRSRLFCEWKKSCQKAGLGLIKQSVGKAVYQNNIIFISDIHRHVNPGQKNPIISLGFLDTRFCIHNYMDRHSVSFFIRFVAKIFIPM